MAAWILTLAAMLSWWADDGSRKMLRFSDAVRAEARRMTDEGATAAPARVVNRADVWLVEDQRSRANVRGHTFDCDEPAERGGTDTAPSPLEYLLAGLGFCQEVMIARNAAVRRLRLDEARIRVRGYFDPRGGHVDGVENRGFDEIRLDVSFTGRETAEAILDLMEAVDRQCYAFNTLRRAAAIRQTVELNGETIGRQRFEPRA